MQTTDIRELNFSDYDSGLYTRALAAITALVTDHAVWLQAEQAAGRDLSGQEIPSGQTVPFQFEQSQMLWGLNKLIEAPHLREQISTEIAATERALFPAQEAGGSSHEIKFRLKRFRDDGVVEVPPLLTSAEIADVVDYVGICRDVTIENSLRHYLVKDVIHAPHLLRAVTAPWLIDLIEDYLGMPPTLMDISLWQSLPDKNTEPVGAQIFHRDRDDFRACKLFVYLNEVGPDQGPHIFVRGSHGREQIKAHLPGLDASGMSKLFYKNGRQIADLVEKLFGSAVTEFTGPAGTSFLENTYGFHRGKVPKHGSRLIFQAMYACIPYAHRIARMATGRLTDLPLGCENTPRTRHLLRLLL